MFYKIITLLTFLIFCGFSVIYLDVLLEDPRIVATSENLFVQRWNDGEYRVCSYGSGGVACTAWAYPESK